MRKKYKFWLIIVGIVALATLFFWLGEPTLRLFDKPLFGQISLALYLGIVIVLFIKYISSKYFGINLLAEKKSKKQESEGKEEKEPKKEQENKKTNEK